jgi:AcrR family transcriptional regulator
MSYNFFMSRRGTELREHILYAAKDVFLEMGFERASMDVIAERARTSKRTLYAHFESKENLYSAIIALVRTLYLGKLRTPGDYSEDPPEALVLFCGRYLEGLLFAWTIRMCRLTIAEAERSPEGSAQYFDVVFTAPRERLSAYLQETFGLSEAAGADAAERLLGRVISPRFLRALYGLDPPSEHLDDAVIRADFDLRPVRAAVADLIASLKGTGAGPRPGA